MDGFRHEHTSWKSETNADISEPERQQRAGTTRLTELLEASAGSLSRPPQSLQEGFI